MIVGRPSRKTPLMSSALNNVVVNPPWNVPTSLVRQDIVPKARYDSSYFQRHGYTVLSGWSNDAEVVDPSMIDWSMISPNNFPYRLRQAPGASNSLGGSNSICQAQMQSICMTRRTMACSRKISARSALVVFG
uniref:L,D-TPase catalytic domain-containing protein n=1 Tax=Yersinia enterocolitica W22703 TaxID=913028 RepID=F4MXD6_YEREN|nr:hypothetical protein YEW_AT04130 [Yersinia enterocolitica W22703]